MSRFFIAACIVSAAALANGQIGCQDGGGGASTEAFGADFGQSDASVPVTKQIMSSLGSVAAVEAGKSSAPKVVQEAFLNSLNGSRGGGQMMGFGGFPWTPDSGRTDPTTLKPSTESIVESDGTIPTCEVTVQLTTLYNTTNGGQASLLNLVFANWANDDVITPWKTVINGPYTQLIQGYNANIDVAQGSTIQATVVEAPVPANGTSSVPVTLIIEAAFGTPKLVPTSVFQNGRKCTLITVGSASNKAAGEAGTESFEQPISLDGRHIIGTDGNIVEFKGLNWFGFDDGVTMPEGLWIDGGAIQRDLVTITQRILLLGFNAVRLPFSMQDLFNKSPANCIQPCRFPSNQEILASVTKSKRRRSLMQASAEGTSCYDKRPPGAGGKYSCYQQKKYGKCNAKFMRGYCKRSCGRCSSPKSKKSSTICYDKRPPGAGGKYSCYQQKKYGKCNASFMRGYCKRSCGRCSSHTSRSSHTSCSDKRPKGRYSCKQQKQFGKCNKSFMKGHCNKTCGRCGKKPSRKPSRKPFKKPSKRPSKTPSRPPSRPPPRTSSSSTDRITVDLKYTPKGTQGICNSYVPGDSTFNRFIFVIQFLARNGIYIILDNQVNFDTTAVTNPSAWLQGWRRIAKAVNNDEQSRNRVIYDALNEPDAFKLMWEPSGNLPGMKDLFLNMFDAVYQINSKSIFLFEGLGQQNYGTLNWGDGLITNESVIKQKRLSDPNPFFKELLTKPYRKQVIVGVHVYPPSISRASTQYTAANGLYERLTLSHGYLNKEGYCNGGDCQVFPVIYGEMGSYFKDPRDLQWLNDIVAYMNNEGAGKDGKHFAISSFFWWSWNANSGDTGGVLAANWKDIVYQKVDYMTRIGLRPWYDR